MLENKIKMKFKSFGNYNITV